MYSGRRKTAPAFAHPVPSSVQIVNVARTNYSISFDTLRTYAVGPTSLRQSGTLFSIVCGFSALRAEKPHTERSESTMPPQAITRLCDAEERNCVSPNSTGIDMSHSAVLKRHRAHSDILFLVRRIQSSATIRLRNQLKNTPNGYATA